MRRYKATQRRRRRSSLRPSSRFELPAFNGRRESSIFYFILISKWVAGAVLFVFIFTRCVPMRVLKKLIRRWIRVIQCVPTELFAKNTATRHLHTPSFQSEYARQRGNTFSPLFSGHFSLFLRCFYCCLKGSAWRERATLKCALCLFDFLLRGRSCGGRPTALFFPF